MGRATGLGAAVGVVALATSVLGQTPPAPPTSVAPAIVSPPGVLFVSPAGEPFRGGADMTRSMRLWFDQADTNHDGVLTLDEFVSDHDRVFALWDRYGDGLLDGGDIGRYEREITPEVTGEDAQGRPFRQVGPRGANSIPAPKIKHGHPPPPRNGAARYGLINETEPLLAADTDADYQVSRDEWRAAAERRFRVLDVRRAGRLAFSDLRLPPEPWAYAEPSDAQRCWNCEYAPLYYPR